MKKKSSWNTSPKISSDLSMSGVPVIDDMLEWMASPVGVEAMDAYYDVQVSLKQASVDVVNQHIIWSDGEKLSITESAKRIHKKYDEYPLELLEEKVIAWLEMDFEPEGYSSEKMDVFEELICQWTQGHPAKI